MREKISKNFFLLSSVFGAKPKKVNWFDSNPDKTKAAIAAQGPGKKSILILLFIKKLISQINE